MPDIEAGEAAFGAQVVAVLGEVLVGSGPEEGGRVVDGFRICISRLEGEMPGEAAIERSLERMVAGICSAFDEEDAGKGGERTARGEAAGSGQRLIQVARADQMGAFGPYVAHTRSGRCPDLPLRAKAPVLQIACRQIRAKRVRRRGRDNPAIGREWIRQR